jgi:hypothetical protein
MAKARVAPTIELLEDVVRGPQPASSEALPWWHLFILNHFLEGVQGRCLRRDPRQAEPLARCCRALEIAAPLHRGKEVKTSPLCGEGILQEKVSLLPEREWHTREGLRLVLLEKALGRVARGSSQDLRVIPRRRTWKTRGGSPLRLACIRRHYHARGGNDGLDRLVKSHRFSAPDGAKGQLGA